MYILSLYFHAKNVTNKIKHIMYGSLEHITSDIIEEDVDSGWTEGTKGRTYVLRTIIDEVVDPALIAKPCALLRAAGDADHTASMDENDMDRDRPHRTGGAG